jgi:mRNA interferase MazF
MPYSSGDVVLVPFPFTDQSGAKKRPAVVVSGNR